MTFIKPEKLSFVIKLLISSIVPLVSGVFYLIFMYNQVVNLDQDITKLKREIEVNQAATADLNQKVFAFFESENVDQIIATLGLVQEKNPDYFESAQKWAFALQQ
ncbi:MAG: hypothetical protein HY093_02530 [Candidatus Liptonbacteria bacterium]|nr:hypothetical protein [Candidatus Liptonbacteria bacterium]